MPALAATAPRGCVSLDYAPATYTAAAPAPACTGAPHSASAPLACPPPPVQQQSSALSSFDWDAVLPDEMLDGLAGAELDAELVAALTLECTYSSPQSREY